MDLGRLIREALRKGPTNVASAVNVDGSGQTTAYSDDEVTIIQQDGETEVIPKPKPKPNGGAGK